MISAQFILAGKAIFTVSSVTGQRYTFKVTHKEATERWPETWFISVLTGPDNTKDYTYLGIVNRDGMIKMTNKSGFGEGSVPVRVARWALNIAWGRTTLPEGYKIQHEGRCGRCGRLLTVPESIESGIGPECAKHAVYAVA